MYFSSSTIKVAINAFLPFFDPSEQHSYYMLVSKPGCITLSYQPYFDFSSSHEEAALDNWVNRRTTFNYSSE